MEYERPYSLNRKNGKSLMLELDNAAKIFPSTLGPKQHHMYRLSAKLRDSVDPEILQRALDITIHRFPSIAACLRRGVFWYWLESVEAAPSVDAESPYKMRGSKTEFKKCCFRILYGGQGISAEFFHGICDGGGAMVFFKTLLAEYLEEKYPVRIPCVKGVLNRQESPRMEEIEDCYPKYAGSVGASRSFARSYRIPGTVEEDGKLHILHISMDVDNVRTHAKAYGLSLTEFLAAALAVSLMDLQRSTPVKREKPIFIAIPVNLRKLFGCSTLRNFSLSVTVGLNPCQGEWSLAEAGKRIHHQMAMLITKKEMEANIAANVQIEGVTTFRWLPLFLKNFLMKGAYSLFGVNSCCLSLSNMGVVELPEEMVPYVEEVGCCMDANPRSTNSCAVLSYNGKLHIQFARSIKEQELEWRFVKTLTDLGLAVALEEV